MKKTSYLKFILISNKRERRRIKKIKRANSKNILFLKHQNYKHPRGLNLSHAHKITIPKKLDLSGNRSNFIKLISDIRTHVKGGKSFQIDHREMESISEEALILLTAEIEQCAANANIKLCGKSKLFPRNRNVGKMLNDIGYWDHFRIKAKSRNVINQNSKHRTYLKIASDNIINGEKIAKLIEFFERMITFTAQTKDKFHDAMTEAAANTVEHAYCTKDSNIKVKKWWLTANLDKSSNELSFIFYDQGLGILNTLESERTSIKIKRLASGWHKKGWSKGRILRELMTTNLSSHNDERRGNGLISFKSFIDDVEDGELTIHTDDVSYSAVSQSLVKYNDRLKGTLISWKIKADNNTSKCIYLNGA